MAWIKVITHFLIIFFMSLMSLAVLAAEEPSLPLYESQELPLYEFGVFLGTAVLPDYPAAGQARSRTIPLPLVHYNGDLLRADDDGGTRFRFINVEKFDLDLSFGGSFPTDTGNNDARSGMPNLDWTAEVGPRLIYYVYRDPLVGQLRIGIPVRANFATDFVKWYGVGYVFAPTVQYDKFNFLTEHLDLFVHYTAHFITEGVADFFYQVAPQFQTLDRAAYKGQPGFLSHEYSVALKYRFNKKNLILGTQYSDFSQSANTGSSLHRSNVNWSYVLAFSWVLHESAARGIK